MSLVLPRRCRHRKTDRQKEKNSGNNAKMKWACHRALAVTQTTEDRCRLGTPASPNQTCPIRGHYSALLYLLRWPRSRAIIDSVEEQNEQRCFHMNVYLCIYSFIYVCMYLLGRDERSIFRFLICFTKSSFGLSNMGLRTAWVRDCGLLKYKKKKEGKKERKKKGNREIKKKNKGCFIDAAENILLA